MRRRWGNDATEAAEGPSSKNQGPVKNQAPSYKPRKAAGNEEASTNKIAEVRGKAWAWCALHVWWVVLFLVWGVWAGMGAERVDSAKEFVGLLVKEDFAGAEAKFDGTMKSALPEAKLKETWLGILQQTGPFKKQAGNRVQRVDVYDVVFVTCEFEKATLDAKVVYDGQGKVAGLFFVSTQMAAKSTPPPYADKKLFREQPFTVGSGEWKLPGTLSLPLKTNPPCAAVVLVHGSGPGDRDETIGANAPFRDLAWGLASRGIAVLRYEKRTRACSAKLATTDLTKFTVREEAIDDAVSAVAQLRKTPGLDPKRIFVLGHSLGGTIAPRIGLADPQVAGLIVLAGSTRPLEDLMVEQVRYLTALQGPLTAEAQAQVDAMVASAKKVKALTAADATSSVPILRAPPAYWLDLRAHDPVAGARELKMRMLILQGARDYQVTTVDFELWKKGLGETPRVTFKLYPDLNHLFITGQGKSTPAEYEKPGNVAEVVVADIASWILAR